MFVKVFIGCFQCCLCPTRACAFLTCRSRVYVQFSGLHAFVSWPVSAYVRLVAEPSCFFHTNLNFDVETHYVSLLCISFYLCSKSFYLVSSRFLFALALAWLTLDSEETHAGLKTSLRSGLFLDSITLHTIIPPFADSRPGNRFWAPSPSA